MKKKLIVALATTLILANGASAAFADNGSNSDRSESSKSSENNRKEFKLTAEQKVAFKAEREAYKAAREAIKDAFHASMEKAHDTYKAAKDAATTEEARNAAKVAFQAEVKVAVQVKTDALKALGPKPEKPENPALTAEQLAAIEQYRLAMITYKADLAAYKVKVEAIRAAYIEALKALGQGPVRPEEPKFND